MEFDELAGQALKNDPRIEQAKQLLLQALEDHQKKITHVRPPNPKYKVPYEELLAQVAGNRGSKLYFPYVGSGIGNGPFVELLDGSVKFDFISGIGPHYWGHGHPDIVKVNIDAAIEDLVMQGNLQQNKEALDFAKLLVDSSKLEQCFLTSSGSMANENALKIAFQKKSPASRILAFERCFMGRTLAMSQITDKPLFRDGLPLNYPVDYVPFFDAAKPEESTEMAVKVLKRHLSRYPGQHAVMCFELVQGEGGFYTAPKEFFCRLMDILKENNILIFDDEIQCFGRTTQLFAFQHFGLEKYIDLVSIGKLSQVCATLFRKEIAPRPGLLSQTFTGSTTALHTGLYIINNLLSGGYFGPEGKIQQIHNHFVKQLEGIRSRHPGILKGPFGIGTMIGFTPFEGENQSVVKLVQDLFEAGVMSFVAGANPTRIRFLLPVGALTNSQINDALKIVEETLLKFDQKDKV